MYTPTEAQKELFIIACRAGDRITRAMQTYTKELVLWLKTQYGDTPPTYEQFWSDREALAILAEREETKREAIRVANLGKKVIQLDARQPMH